MCWAAFDAPHASSGDRPGRHQDRNRGAGPDGAVALRRRVATRRTMTPCSGTVRTGGGGGSQLGARGSIGMAIPGTESFGSDLIKNANTTWLIGKPLRRDWKQVLGRAVRLANDANCFALSEASDGAGGRRRHRIRRDCRHRRRRRCGGGRQSAGRRPWHRRRMGSHSPARAQRGRSGDGALCYCGKRGTWSDLGRGRVRLANDANCLALSEASDGAAAGARDGVRRHRRHRRGRRRGDRRQGDGRRPRHRRRMGHIPPARAYRRGSTDGAALLLRQARLPGESGAAGTGLAADFKRVTGRDGIAEAIAASDGAEERAAMDRWVDRLARAWRPWSIFSIPT